MKRHICLLTLAILVLAMNGMAQSLSITIKNIKEPKGSIRVGLFNDEDKFLKDPFDGKVVDVKGTEVTVVFENLKPGDYAISVIHDENANGELDSNVMGIPKEGFGFGNDAMGMFGPPSFDKAKITLTDKPQTQVIKMKYL
jgi:uncharacterized protein (DUF2141 family)